MIKKLVLAIFLLLITANLSYAMIVSSVNQGEHFPGEESNLDITIKNTINANAEDVSLNLVFTNLPFIPIGGSERSTNKLKEDKEKTLSYIVKSSQDIAPGNYNIPYVLSYTDSSNERITKQGSLGVVVSANTELKISTELDNNVLGQKGKITLKIVNSGFGDIKFVNVKINPEGYTLLSSSNDYIGNIGSDDFETSSFDVIFNENSPRLTGVIEYKDFNNNDKIENINLPLKVYSREEAVNFGVIQNSKVPIYIGIVIALIILFFIYRFIRKRLRRNNKK
ncbi:hypothetical protein COU56_03630 [Candidatus Pacearchaeota archaeon CG10_big_fil_rev_8_21_14_0_10_31_9]|nr:MAG: hypothetical protein AUJ62_00980 [Candidatus Pacearchaeota archaeon CG1_02_32_21]PIN93503.1 MAG: hypothetical protein COU56_03630 [Candidatus Pacearchaeota archaeon CG10_big_fil_rev_8_21_14_0_10_31_9]